VARRLAALDETYIRAQFQPLDVVAADHHENPNSVRTLIAARRLPQPAYRLDDGTDMVPADYFALLDAAGSLEALPAWFIAEYLRAMAGLNCPCDEATAREEWEAYLDGGFFVCLREVTPHTIACKAACITSIDQLLENPAPHDQGWCDRLREAVGSLHSIERCGAILDPPRWGGPMSPQWYGAYLHSYFPDAFAVTD
jgi:hypothetical protein